jgi:hypothetical protein
LVFWTIAEHILPVEGRLPLIPRKPKMIAKIALLAIGDQGNGEVAKFMSTISALAQFLFSFARLSAVNERD